MDRTIVYPSAIPQDTDQLNLNRNVLIALGRLAQDLFGTATVAGGLPCSPNSPPNLTVVMGAGSIYALDEIDSTAYGSLAPNTTLITKQGIQLGNVILACAAPTTPGDSIAYLIEGAYEDSDGENAVLAYYSAANPPSPFSGPSNSGASQPTARQGLVALVAKPGIPAPTGTQVPPSADSGFIPLYVVTVAFGQTAINAGNIAVAPGAPFISSSFLTQATGDARYLKVAGGTMTGPLNGTSATFSISVTVDGISVQNAGMLTSGLVALARLGNGTPTANTWLRGDQNWAAPQFNQLAGQIAPGQVPVGAVTQYQSALEIAPGQISSLAQLLEAAMLSGAVTLEADPGGTPANGTPGSLVAYF